MLFNVNELNDEWTDCKQLHPLWQRWNVTKYINSNLYLKLVAQVYFKSLNTSTTCMGDFHFYQIL